MKSTNLTKKLRKEEDIIRRVFHYIPVLDKNQKVVGVVTPSSLIDLLQKC